MDKIKFIRVYHSYNETICEIIYKSGRVRMIFGGYNNLPLTAVAFLDVAKGKSRLTNFTGKKQYICYNKEENKKEGMLNDLHKCSS